MTAAETSDPAEPGVKRKRPPLFLERQSYRRRRLTDAARLLPVVGAGLFLVPLLWSDGRAPDIAAPVSTSRAIVYIFGAWAALIAATAVLGAGLRYAAGRRGEEETEAG